MGAHMTTEDDDDDTPITRADLQRAVALIMATADARHSVLLSVLVGLTLAVMGLAAIVAWRLV